jgi:hypothetical protein
MCVARHVGRRRRWRACSAAKLLACCRRTLAWTYVHAYFIKEAPARMLYEFAQASLETLTVRVVCGFWGCCGLRASRVALRTGAIHQDNGAAGGGAAVRERGHCPMDGCAEAVPWQHGARINAILRAWYWLAALRMHVRGDLSCRCGQRGTTFAACLGTKSSFHT